MITTRDTKAGQTPSSVKTKALGFAGELQSHAPQIIKNTLMSLLNSVTDPSVLTLDKDFFRLTNNKAKMDFLAVLEKSSPLLLERWAHYCWLRLELTYLANQRAALNALAKAKGGPDSDFPLLDSIESAIRDDVAAGVPIQKSIATLRKINLEMVGTEHPTDPLSQQASDLLVKIAVEMEKNTPSAKKIVASLAELQETDPIPPFKRDVEEEVNRNINLMLDKVYDIVPHFIESVLQAYRKAYGEALFSEYQQEILQALEGGLQPSGVITKPVLQAASWAGFDADGNTNITPDTMRYAIRLHRIRAAEKHIVSLDKNIIAAAKKIERTLRDEIQLLNPLQFEGLVDIGGQTVPLLRSFMRFQTKVSMHLTSRNYGALIECFDEQQKIIEGWGLVRGHHDAIMRTFKQQYEKAVLLQKLTHFSGAYQVKCKQTGEEKLEQGDLQKLQKKLEQFKHNIRENTNAIEVQLENGQSVTQTQYAAQQYQKALRDHKEVFNLFPSLQMPMRCFGIQLNSFGMTYGMGHVRQDSSVFTAVWDALLKDLCQEAPFAQFSLFKILKTKGYLGLSDQERAELHKRLNAEDPEGSLVLQTIRTRHKAGAYRKGLRYQAKKSFISASRELERVELALRHEDMFENIIISNCESAANILEVESLLNVFSSPQQRKVTVVPLLEKRQDLENFENILTDFIKSKRTQKAPLAEIMVGFSDTERVSGLPALISVQEVQEKFIQLCEKYGVQAKIFHGPGGDPNRGGMASNYEKLTMQGKVRRDRLATRQSIAEFCEGQFHAAYEIKAQPSRHTDISKLPPTLHKALEICKQQGASFYEHLQDTKNGLGKLSGFMLGQGAHWMVDLLNSSSRATQRGIADSHGDRSIAVQTGGVRPKGYIDPHKPRAITATQMKELLRDNLHLVMGPGFGLRAIGLKSAERLYDSSVTVRDMVEKTLFGLARADFFITEQAFFGENSHFLPKDAAERKKWAEECRTQYPKLLQKLNVEEMSLNEPGKTTLLKMLSRFYAYLVEEHIQTRDYIKQLDRIVHFEKYCSPKAPQKLKKPTDLLFHRPKWQAYEEEINHDASPLYLLFARQTYQVSHGENLDKVYPGLNEQKPPYKSRLSGVGRLLGNVGAGLTSARTMPPAFFLKIFLDYSKNLRPGVERAEKEREKLYGQGKFLFFNDRKEMLENFFAKRNVQKQAVTKTPPMTYSAPKAKL